jgi:hypothetical protein
MDFIMEERDIDLLMEAGWWVQVSPVVLADRKAWTCAVYKRGKKTGNWITEFVQSFPTPYKCYEWAGEILQKEIYGNREQV